jgi:cytochrome P450
LRVLQIETRQALCSQNKQQIKKHLKNNSNNMTTNNNSEASLLSAVAVGISAAILMAVLLHRSSSRNKNKKATLLVFRDAGNPTSNSDVDGNNTTLGISSNAVSVDLPDITNDKALTLSSLKSSIAAALFAEAKQQGDDGKGDAGIECSEEMRLFMQDTKEEVCDLAALLRPLARGNYHRGFYDRSGIRGAVALVCTCQGRNLSASARSMPPLERFPAPTWVSELPRLGHILAFARGCRKLIIFNAYDNLFRGRPDKTLRVKQFPYRLDDVMNREHYNIDYNPHEDEGLVLTTDPDMLSEMLARQKDFPKMWTSFKERKVNEFAPTGLFTSSTTSKEWETAHGVLPKYFNAIRIKHYYPVVLEKTQSFVHEWIKLGDGKVVEDVGDWLTCMTADAVVKASMDYDMRCVERKGAAQPLHPFLVSFRYCFKYISRQLKGNKKELAANYAKHKRVCEDIVAELVEKTRHQEIGGPLSFLSGMLDNRSTTNNEFVRLQDFFGHVINIMVAGHETTAATLGFCLAELCNHPDCLVKAVNEIESVIGTNSSPTYEDIGRLQYVEACFRVSTLANFLFHLHARP